jgi:hypothetical protein
MKQVEHGLQIGVARLLNLCLDPERTWWSAIDHGAGKMSKRAAGMMKKRGVKRGMPDIVIMWWHNVVGKMIGIELKAGKGRLTPDQRLVERQWNKMGFAIYTARSLGEVQQILRVENIPMYRKMFVGAT